MKKNIKKFQSGFTLMEVMVSVSIFAIIITIGIGSLLTINTTLQKTRAERQAIDGVSFLLDTMTRQIRTGTQWNVQNNSISFTPQADKSENSSGEKFTYVIEGEEIYFKDTNGSYNVTPAGVTITNLEFIDGESDQPYVTIHLQANVQSGRQNSQINIRTGVSQRAIEFDDSERNLEIIPDSPTRGEPFTANSAE